MLYIRSPLVRISIACTIPSQGTQMVQNLKWEKCYLQPLKSCRATIALVMSVMMQRGIPDAAIKMNVASAMWKRDR